MIVVVSIYGDALCPSDRSLASVREDPLSVVAQYSQYTVSLGVAGDGEASAYFVGTSCVIKLYECILPVCIAELCLILQWDTRNI